MKETSAFTVAVAAEVPTGVLATVKSAAQMMWTAISTMMDDADLEVPAVRLVVADDVMAAAEQEGKALGLPADRRVGSDRLGGIVGGKALVAEDRSRAAVIVTGETFRGQHGLSELSTATAVAHEFGHLYYGGLRDKHRGARPDVWLAWEVAETIALLAAEEYRVDRLAVLLAEQVVKLTDDQGSAVSVTDILGDSYVEAVDATMPAVVPGLVDTVWDYRNRRIDLDTMWPRVARTSEDITLLLAHADAHTPNGQPAVLETVGHPNAAELLKPLWLPLLEHVECGRIIPEAEEWRDDAAELQRLGREGWMTAWDQLGLRPRPEGDGMYIAVGDSLALGQLETRHGYGPCEAINMRPSPTRPTA